MQARSTKEVSRTCGVDPPRAFRYRIYMLYLT
jgi:hypothetical protein